LTGDCHLRVVVTWDTGKIFGPLEGTRDFTLCEGMLPEE